MATNNDKDEGQEAATDLWNMLAEALGYHPAQVREVVIRESVPCGCAEDQSKKPLPESIRAPKPPKPQNYHGAISRPRAPVTKTMAAKPVTQTDIEEITRMVRACSFNVTDPEKLISEMIADARRTNVY